MGPSFPADGWSRHVTWVGRWRLPQRVRAGLETRRLLPWPLPLATSAGGTWAPLFPPSTSLPWDAGASSARRFFFTGAPGELRLPAGYLTGGWRGHPRERPIPGPAAPLILSFPEGGGGGGAAGGQPYCSFLPGRPVPGGAGSLLCDRLGLCSPTVAGLGGCPHPLPPRLGPAVLAAREAARLAGPSPSEAPGK